MGLARVALRLGVVSALLLGGVASALLAARVSAGATTTPTTAAAVSTLVTSPASSVLEISGHGWGHGLGLSQWGAYGYARHGFTYDEILGHYYSGTTLGPAPVSTVRVLLAVGKRASLSSPGEWSVSDALGTKVTLAPGSVSLAPKRLLASHPELRPPLTFTGEQPLVVGGKPYRGKIAVSSDGTQVQVVDLVGLEGYLKGVVPSEMPSDWSPEALKAQAVAARSYALANLTKGRSFDLYGDTRSQVYGGVNAESPSASAAVEATKGQVVLAGGKVADTLFFSTSGGRTASAVDSTSVGVPYLVSVADPYDALSPYHAWGPVLLDAARVARKLKLAAPILALQVGNGTDGRAKTVTVVSTDESQVTLTGSQVRDELDLRSTWFRPAVLQLLPAARTMTYGGASSLHGRSSDAGPVSLEAKAAGLDWAPAGDLTLGANGAFSTIVRPQVTTQYRLARGSVRIGLTRLSVAPRIAAQVNATGAEGAIAPAVAGATVALQQQSGAGWTVVASTITDASGAWSIRESLEPGRYRIRCAPRHGLAPGVSVALPLP